MTYLLWTLQGILALLFLFAGSMKLILPIEEMTADIALPGLLLRFIGIAEVLGGLGLLLPSLFRIRTELTPLAAGGLVVVMLGATVLTALTMGVILAVIPLTVGLLTAFVGYGRWQVAPHRTQTSAREPQPAGYGG